MGLAGAQARCTTPGPARAYQLDLPRLDRPTSIDFGASTDPERPTSIDLGASTCPARPTLIDFGSILRSIFIVFRGYIVRATRSAARRAEPSFLLAGAVLRRVRWRSDDAEKQRISSQNPLSDGSRTSRPREISRLSFLDATSRRFWSPRHAPVRSWALVLASWGVFGDAPSATRVCRGRLETLPGRSGNALGPLGASR